MRVILLTSGKVDYKFRGSSTYESIKITTAGKRFPHIISLPEEIIGVAKRIGLTNKHLIVSATSAQARDTAKVIGEKFGIQVIYDENFLPLRFDLKSLMSNVEFDSLKERAFDQLRLSFLNHFYNDKLIDSHEVFRNKYQRLMEIIKNNPNRDLLIISHSYLIQLFSIYSEIGDEMFKNKKLLFKSFDPSRQFGFLRFIELNIKL